MFVTLLETVQDVSAVVGVNRPTAVIPAIAGNRTMFEMYSLANEMAQRIAWNTRDWQMLQVTQTFMGDGVTTEFPLPNNYVRMLKNGNVWRSTDPVYPMRFEPDSDVWLQRRIRNYFDSRGEWTLMGNKMLIVPALSSAPVWQNSTGYKAGNVARDIHPTPTITWWRANSDHTSAPEPNTFAQARILDPLLWTSVPNSAEFSATASFIYIQRNCIVLTSGGYGQKFAADTDKFWLEDRVLKLGMIWQWKANKGSPYAEDMATYADAVGAVMGSDKPSPIIVGRAPVSQNARIAYPWPVPTVNVG